MSVSTCNIKLSPMCAPVRKVCIMQPTSRLRSFDVPYIFYSKFSKSRARNLQTFMSAVSLPQMNYYCSHCNCMTMYQTHVSKF